MGSIRSYFKCLKWRNLIIAFSAILIGLLFILTPQTSADVICYVAGILLLASGIAAVVSYLASRRLFGSYALVSGIVLLVCGVFCLLRPEVIQGLLTVIFGVFLVIDGMVTLQDGIDCARAKLGGWWVLAALAVITIALGCVILFGKFDSIMLLAGTLGVDTSSLLAILSVAGLAVSLSIQDSLSNLASAVVLLTTHPFKVGDFIEVSGKSGTVRQIGVFHTQIATPDNQLVYLPNSQITSAQITNVTGNALRRIEIVVQASYDAAPDTVKEALVRAAQHPKRVDFEPVFARLSGYGDSAISYTLRLWTAGCDYWDVYYDVLENISREFSRSNIEMTYPHINVHMGS